MIQHHLQDTLVENRLVAILRGLTPPQFGTCLR